MLIKAIVENFKSFNQRTEFNMITSNKIRVKKEHEIAIKKLNLLKNAVIYGANASGKSNLVEFFSFFKFCLEKTIPYRASNLFCKQNKENADRASTFELQFSIDDKIYDYGFSAILSQRTINEEWLYELNVGASAQCIFEYRLGANPVLGIKKIGKEDEIKFNTYAEDYQGLKATLFLSELNRNKKYNDDSPLIIFKDVYKWLTSNLIIFLPDTLITNFEYFYNSQSLEKVNKFIQSFDTGITDAGVDKISIEDIKSKLPKEIFDDLIERIKECAENNTHCKFSMRSFDEFFNVEIEGDEEPAVTTLKFKHSNSYFDYNYDEESDGTRRLFDLIDMLLIKKEDVVFVVDELERSLHPKLTEHFLKLFNEIHLNKRVQLIFTTHESSIMDQELFRRDEIWFIERGVDNNSVIYSLDRFKERYDKKLSKAYLEGRYGAIPIFKTFEFKGDD